MSRPPADVTSEPRTVAAVDLGSNSFHLVVGRVRGSDLSIMDRLKESVRLGGGLDASKRIRPQAMERALGCLARFGERVHGLPFGAVRAVGTNTLRQARNADELAERGESVLGHPIEVISGFEEARLIYLGATVDLAQAGGTRLVVDIGGGSTELIAGLGPDPMLMESLYMGCVGLTQRWFPDGELTSAAYEGARLSALQELEPVVTRYRAHGWDEAVGASGTIRAAVRIARECGWATEGMTRSALARMEHALLAAGHVGRLKLPGLSGDRAQVLPGGLAVLSAIFEGLGIEHMLASDGALREGLLYDLLGRIRHTDVRDRTVAVLGDRYHIDHAHAKRVESTALALLDAVGEGWDTGGASGRMLLGWAARLHEIGLAISHSQYHKHGAYILRNTDMAGFSRNEQALLATLVRLHRRKFADHVLDELPRAWRAPARRLALLLRVAVVLHRARADDPPPLPKLGVWANGLKLSFPPGWLDRRPLTYADLMQESDYLRPTGIRLELE